MSRNVTFVFAASMLMMFACLFLGGHLRRTVEPWTPPTSAAWRARLSPLVARGRALELAIRGGLAASEVQTRAEALQQDASALRDAAEADRGKEGLRAASAVDRYAQALTFRAQLRADLLDSADPPLVAARRDLDVVLRLPSSHDAWDALWAKRSDILFALAILVFAPLLILVPVGIPLLQALQGRHIRRVGLGMRARITEVVREGVINYVPRYRLRLRLETGHSSTVHVLSYSGFALGDDVSVLVDLRHPGRAVLA